MSHKRRRQRSPDPYGPRTSRRPDSSQICSDYRVHKTKLAKIFFRAEDLISQGSKDYDDFWAFLQKYQLLDRQQLQQGRNSGLESRLTGCNVRLVPDDVDELLNRIPYQDQDGGDGVLTAASVAHFRGILTLFVDFLQKEKFAKLIKLRSSQSELPIAEYRQDILDTISRCPVVIIAGDTGCGKSTQLPQFLLKAGFQNIACTQPRRIACISLANRVGFETLNEYGSEIGYQIRFDRQKTDRTRVLFLTEGLLLRQLSADAGLNQYDVIILDEIHERHIHTDFLLGAMKCLLMKRSDLKVVLMSATINLKLFKDYFHNVAPVVQVPGRLYPIELKYLPIPDLEKSASSEKLNPAPYVRILQMIDAKYADTERGDVLIFLSGIKEITCIVDACKEYAERSSKWIVLPLHSTLSLADQDKVFDYPPAGVRKCIVATNIAETSITIDGVRFVIDSGKVKEMQYDPVCKMRRLKEFWVSKASAEQRKGRAGRTGPGVCFRLYSEADYQNFKPYSTPEMQRVPLDSLILQLIAMGLSDVRKFPFVEAPPPESIENSIMVLKEQDVLASDESLTLIGKVLSNLPVDVGIGKMLIMGTLFHQVDSVLTLAAALSVQSPFTTNAYRDQDCIAARRNLDSDHGDPITLMNAFRQWLEVKTRADENSRKWCQRRGLEEQRFYEMTKLRDQFEELLDQSNLLKVSDQDISAASSSERAIRHGQLKLLRQMKKDYHLHLKTQKSKKKVLRVEPDLAMNLEGEGDFDGEACIDIKDVEFRMKTDARKLNGLLESAKTFSYKDVTLLKVILCSGLFPQVALADEFNHCKGGADQLFHTRVKPFNLLHPNCFFAASPEYITLDDADCRTDIPDSSRKHPFSSRHQLLLYLSLLETNKPYLVNVIRMPTAQTLLLFSHQIDTDVNMTRMVCDQWIQLTFSDAHQAQDMMLKAAQLRAYWKELLTRRLGQTEFKDSAQHLEHILSSGLVSFMHSDVVYSVRRLLPGDVKVMYSHVNLDHGSVHAQLNPFRVFECGDASSTSPLPKKSGDRGLKMTEYLTYASLSEDESCLSSASTVLERMKHQADSLLQDATKVASDQTEAASCSSSSALVTHYFCHTCHTDLRLTPSDILRHKVNCQAREHRL